MIAMARFGGAWSDLDPVLTNEQQLESRDAENGDSPPPPYSPKSDSSEDESVPPTEPARQASPGGPEYFKESREDICASLPYNQLAQQVRYEEARLQADHEETPLRYRSPEADFGKLARQLVEGHWRSQGIWNDKWTDGTLALWKHEGPPILFRDNLCGPIPSSERERRYGAFGIYRSVSPPPRLRRPDASTFDRWNRGGNEQEASRPLHQFNYQVAQERKHHLRKDNKEAFGYDWEEWCAKINTIAYGAVKTSWIERGIWNKAWDVLPGLRWKHEILAKRGQLSTEDETHGPLSWVRQNNGVELPGSPTGARSEQLDGARRSENMGPTESSPRSIAPGNNITPGLSSSSRGKRSAEARLENEEPNAAEVIDSVEQEDRQLSPDVATRPRGRPRGRPPKRRMEETADTANATKSDAVEALAAPAARSGGRPRGRPPKRRIEQTVDNTIATDPDAARPTRRSRRTADRDQEPSRSEEPSRNVQRQSLRRKGKRKAK